MAVAEQDVVFSETYYGYSAREHPQGHELVRYLALLLGSKPALWLALITSGEFGFEREVIEKSTIDKILVPKLESLAPTELDRITPLFESVVRGGSEAAWDEVDAWVAALYGLRKRDLQVISDTLQFNLPFADNRREAQSHASEEAIEKFCEALITELEPWGERLGRTFIAIPAFPLGASPWRSLRICSALEAAKRPEGKGDSTDWFGALCLADQLAATEVMYPESASGCLWLGRLDQARYWTQSQARLVAQRMIWEHVDLLAGRATQ